MSRAQLARLEQMEGQTCVYEPQRILVVFGRQPDVWTALANDQWFHRQDEESYEVFLERAGRAFGPTPYPN